MFLCRVFSLSGAAPLRRNDVVGDLSWRVCCQNSQTLQLQWYGVQISSCCSGCTQLLHVFYHWGKLWYDVFLSYSIENGNKRTSLFLWLWIWLIAHLNHVTLFYIPGNFRNQNDLNPIVANGEKYPPPSECVLLAELQNLIKTRNLKLWKMQKHAVGKDDLTKPKIWQHIKG